MSPVDNNDKSVEIVQCAKRSSSSQYLIILLGHADGGNQLVG